MFSLLTINTRIPWEREIVTDSNDHQFHFSKQNHFFPNFLIPVLIFLPIAYESRDIEKSQICPGGTSQRSTRALINSHPHNERHETILNVGLIQLDRRIFIRRGWMPSLIDRMAMARLKCRWPLAMELEDVDEPLELASTPPPLPSSSSSDVSIEVKTPQRTPITKNMMMNSV